MYQSTPLIALPVDSLTAIPQATLALQRKGLQVIHSFDLQIARAAHQHCSCPNHGTQKCDCQLVVLLVYNEVEAPVTIVAHGVERETEFELIDSPQQPADPKLRERIRSILSLLGSLSS